LLSERQRLSLQDIVDYIDRIFSHLAQLTAQDFTTFERNELVSDAVERCMGRISEAAGRLGEEADDIAPGPPWADIAVSVTNSGTSTTIFSWQSFGRS